MIRLQNRLSKEVSDKDTTWSYLGNLGNVVLRNFYRALSTSYSLPKVLLKRAAANGLARETLKQALRVAKSPSLLAEIFVSKSASKLSQAMYWSDLGLKFRARDSYLESSLWALYAELAISQASELAEEVGISHAKSYLLASPYFDNPAQPVEIHFPGKPLNGYLRFPTSKLGSQSGFMHDFPCVILFNTFNSPKEELYYTENALLSANLATLSFDYPSTSKDLVSEFFDIEELGNALYLFAHSRPEIDSTRLALHGLSLGGQIALHLAVKFPERFRAIATISAPLDLLLNCDLKMEALRRELSLNLRTTKAAFSHFAHSIPIRDCLHRIEAPLLVASGGKDMIASPEETRFVYEHATSNDKKLIICPSASHNCYEMMPSLRYEISHWIKQRI